MILAGLMFSGRIMGFTGDAVYELTFRGLAPAVQTGNSAADNSFMIGAGLLLIIIAALAAILLYRYRKLQKTAVFAAIAGAVIVCALELYYWNLAAKTYNAGMMPHIRMVFPVIIIILAVLALSGISRDEKIVKSYDRLR